MLTQVKFAFYSVALTLTITACSFEDIKDDGFNGVEEEVVHNARNSLDYYGIYKGTLPCADCTGIGVTLELSPENAYVIKYTYLGKNDSTVALNQGNFEWDGSGFVVTLMQEAEPNTYFVAENALFKLDNRGNKITGDLAEKYILRK
jgi:uncharacterized lipoprotein NlpE involved in copper resistance